VTYTATTGQVQITPLLTATLRTPSGTGPFPVFVTIPGGPDAPNFDYMGPTAEALRTAGAIVLQTTYRSIGKYGGGYPQTFDDVRDAIRVARELSPKYGGSGVVTLVAHSYGGFPGATVALDLNGPDRYASLDAITSNDQVSVMPEFTGGATIDSLVGLRKLPVLVAWGTGDTTTRINEFSPLLTRALQAAGYPVTAAPLEGGHMAALAPDFIPTLFKFGR
jgi:pimeloyl-ACP methyl ester carboxylesterase